MVSRAILKGQGMISIYDYFYTILETIEKGNKDEASELYDPLSVSQRNDFEKWYREQKEFSKSKLIIIKQSIGVVPKY